MYIKSLSKVLPLVISPLKFVNLGLISLSKNLKMAITQKVIDWFFFQGPFCVHMGIVFQKTTLLTFLQFARVKKTHQPNVLSHLLMINPVWSKHRVMRLCYQSNWFKDFIINLFVVLIFLLSFINTNDKTQIYTLCSDPI